MVKITGAYGKLKTWVTTRLTTHTAIASAHHIKYTDSEVDAIVATHTAIASAHHTNHEAAASESASFKDVNIAVNEAYKQATNIILRIKDLNTFVGIDAGKVTTGNKNVFIGSYAGYLNTTGYRNNFIGGYAGYSNTTGYCNNFIGSRAGYSNTTGPFNAFVGCVAGYSNTIGNNNNFMGNYAGYKNTTGYKNVFIGSYAGYSNTTGYYNNFIGYYAGYSNTIGNNNNFIGNYAGYYETGNDKLFIDNQKRLNETDARVKALIYGIFNATKANQLVRLNGVLELSYIKNGSTQANAGAAINEVWKTNGHATLPDNVLMIGV